MTVSSDRPLTSTIELAPDLAELAGARKFLGTVACEAGFPEPRVFDITLVCSEAIANAIEHAPIKDRVAVTVHLHADRLEVEVAGPGEFQTPDRMQGRTTRGLGLPLMAKLSDHLALYSRPGGGTLVAITFYRPGAERREETQALPPSIQELIESNELLSAITDTSPVGMYVLEPDFRYSWANESYRSFLDEPFRSLDIRGLHVLDVLPGRPREVLTALEGVSQRGERFTVEDYKLEGFSRGTTYWRMDAVPLKTDREKPPYGILALVTEATDTRLAEDRFLRAFHTQALGQAIVRGGGVIVQANEALAQMTGYAREEMIGRLVTEVGLATPNLRSTILNDLERDGKVANFELEIRQKSGEARWVSQTVEPIELNRERHYLSLFLDITERKRAERALHESQQHLKEELQAAQALWHLATRSIAADDVQSFYDDLLDTVVGLLRADFASLQLLHHDESGRPGQLELLTYRGFTQEAAEFWRWVTAESKSTCGRVLSEMTRVVVSDVETSELMAGSNDLAMFQKLGIRSLQTTPILSRSRKLLGAFSTHWHQPHVPTPTECRTLDKAARQAAEMMERTR